jgi:hypothetical protein
VSAVGPERQRLDANDRGKVKVAIKVRKQRSPARRLPFQAIAKFAAIDVHKQQVGLPGEMLRGGLNDLRGGRKMDETVAVVDLRAAENAGVFSRPS